MECKTEPLPYGGEHGVEGHVMPSAAMTGYEGVAAYPGPGHGYPAYPACGEEGRAHPQQWPNYTHHGVQQGSPTQVYST